MPWMHLLSTARLINEDLPQFNGEAYSSIFKGLGDKVVTISKRSLQWKIYKSYVSHST